MSSLDSSALLLDVAQFFPSINHEALVAILRKQGFAREICGFFDHYLRDRKTQFMFNGAVLDPMDFSTGVGQGSALSPVLTGLYLAPVLHRAAPLEKVRRVVDDDGDEVFIRTQWTPESIRANGHRTVQFFVDDGLILVAGKLASDAPEEDQLKYNNVLLRRIFEELVANMRKLGLAQESDKLELMHFRRRQKGEIVP